MEKTHQIQSLMVTEEVYRLRELDGKVASELFGWENVKYGPGKDFQGLIPGGVPSRCGIQYVREYSSSWTGTGLILDLLRKNNLQFVFFSEEGETETFTFEVYREGVFRVTVTDANPHKAVALAALEAKPHIRLR